MMDMSHSNDDFSWTKPSKRLRIGTPAYDSSSDTDETEATPHAHDSGSDCSDGDCCAAGPSTTFLPDSAVMPMECEEQEEEAPAPLVSVPYDPKKNHANHTIVTKNDRLYKLCYSSYTPYYFVAVCPPCGTVVVPYDLNKDYANRTIVTRNGRLCKLYHDSDVVKKNHVLLCSSCAAVGVTTVTKQADGICKKCAGTSMNGSWRQRYDELVAACARVGAKLLNPRETWAKECTNNKFKPKLVCLKHPGTVINTTRIGSLLDTHLGCVQCNPSMRLWATPEGYDRLVAVCARVGAKLLNPRSTWVDECTNNRFKPKLECIEHPGTVIKTTSIMGLVNNQNLGCKKCRHKTEAMLFEWLKKQHPGWRHNVLKLKNPKTNGTMSVDFDNPILRVGFELDGNIDGGHFDDDPANETPHRDLEKEKQVRAAPHEYQMLRVLQLDVWHDKNGWDNWALGELKRWATRFEEGKPPQAARHPDAPEYLGGIYARLRPKSAAPEDVCPVAPLKDTTAEEPPWGTGNVLMMWTGEFIW